MLTVKEIEEILKNVSVTYKTWKDEIVTDVLDGENFWKSLSYDSSTTKYNIDEFEIKYVEGYGGAEGGGEAAYVVFTITEPGQDKRYFRKEGYYASHYGTDWDGALYEVEPQEKTITVYPRKG